MTHAFVVDYRPTSTTSGQEVRIPVTVLEVPPMRVAAVRFYGRTPYGLQSIGEVWAPATRRLQKRVPASKEGHPRSAWDEVDREAVEEVRVVAQTQPDKVSAVPKKVPEIMEIQVGGGTVEERMEYAKKLLGKEVRVEDFTQVGAMVDVAAITRGKGFQGPVKRWGIKLLSHKDSKHRRQAGTTGSFKPGFSRPTAPQAGQVGYHQRTEYNKRVLQIGEKGEEITPNGGFLHYGQIRNSYLILHGSVPGPAKRLVRLRDPARLTGVRLEEAPDITYLSTESKQGT
jgi:large subunit ribosomal protein L3